MTEEKISYYSPNSLYSKGLFFLFKEMFVNLGKSRELIWNLIIRNFSDKYRKSLLGWGWVFLMPIVTMAAFLTLNISGVLRIGQLSVPYPIWGLISFSIWNLFSNGLAAVTPSLIIAENLIAKINFPKDTIIFASIGQIIIDFLIRMLLVLVVFGLYLRFPNWQFFLLPLLVLPTILLVTGLGFITSIMQIVFRDTVNFINVGLSLLLFLIPVMYDLPRAGLLFKINKFNPLFYLIAVPREVIFEGKSDFILAYFISSLISVFIFLAGWLLFHLTESKLAERI